MHIPKPALNVRCHDEKCEVREQCHRWLLRNDSPNPVLIHATTLRPMWQCFNLPCSNAWVTEEYQEVADEATE